MRKNLPPVQNDRLVEFFHRHIIPIYFTFKKDSDRACRIVTSFVMSINSQWLLITAGHCIDGIQENISKGYVIERCRLIDCMGINASYKDPIPFEYNESVATKLSYDPHYDYGIIYLSEHYKRLLEANGVEPLTEEAWENQPDRIDFFKLIGVPSELSEATPDVARVASTLLDVIALPERPECFEETDAPTLWGQIRIGEPMTDINGMSGGPIFAFQRQENGELRYWLHAVQSRWFFSSKLIAACQMKPLGVFLKEFMEGKHQHLIKDDANIAS